MLRKGKARQGVHLRLKESLNIVVNSLCIQADGFPFMNNLHDLLLSSLICGGRKISHLGTGKADKKGVLMPQGSDNNARDYPAFSGAVTPSLHVSERTGGVRKPARTYKQSNQGPGIRPVRTGSAWLVTAHSTTYRN